MLHLDHTVFGGRVTCNDFPALPDYNPAMDGSCMTQAEMIAEVYAAFAGVGREGGVSWSESAVRDGFGEEAECLVARAADLDRAWTELVDDPTWKPDRGVGGLCFLDAIGFRYYLPVALVRSIRTKTRNDALYFLTLPSPGDELHNHTLEKWSRLNDEQRRCVLHYLQYMMANDELSKSDCQEANNEVVGWWQEPIDSYWGRFAQHGSAEPAPPEDRPGGG